MLRGASPYKGVNVLPVPPPFHSSLYDVKLRPPVFVPVTLGMVISMTVLVLVACTLRGAEIGLLGLATMYTSHVLMLEYVE